MRWVAVQLRALVGGKLISKLSDFAAAPCVSTLSMAGQSFDQVFFEGESYFKNWHPLSIWLRQCSSVDRLSLGSDIS